MAEGCRHEKFRPKYRDNDIRKVDDADEVRRRFPRFEGKCPGCGKLVFLYSSFLHYISGDW